LVDYGGEISQIGNDMPLDLRGGKR